MHFVIRDYTVPSRNQMRRWHWQKVRAKEQEARILTRVAVQEAYNGLPDTIQVPVDIHIRAHRPRCVDADNVDTKGIIDGLVTCGLLRDDCPPWVRRVTTECAQGDPRVEVEIVTI